MTKSNIVLNGLLHAAAATAYIGLVTFVMSHATAWFGEQDHALTGMAAIMLFVLSAAVMGVTVFGRPVLWYIDGKKIESFWLLGSTILSFFALTLLVFISLAFVK